MIMRPDLLLINIGQLATLKNKSKGPLMGEEMRSLSIIEDGAIAIKNGRIIAVGKTKDVLSAIQDHDSVPIMQFPKRLVIPGLIDSHTHLVFGGSREHDFAMKLAGKTYMEILDAGGGILNTLTHTRTSSPHELAGQAWGFLESMIQHGDSVIEAKSGYGLDVENELKILRVIRSLNERTDVEIVPTFLGAHAVPPEFEGRTDDYVDLVINEMIPSVAHNNLAEFCDVFCEKGVFDVEQSRRILLAARDVGMALKVHADEIVQLGGAELAAEVGAVSADHLLMASDDGIEAMRKAGTIATLLPATAFSLNTDYANARKMIDIGLPVALATDFNPNCANESMFFTMALACYKMKMNPREVITASTLNAAYALNRGDETGSIEVGKRADILILDCPNPEYISWRFGKNLTHTVIANGEVVYTKYR